MDWSWIADHHADIVHYGARNLYLALVSVAIGLAISLPMGVLCARFRHLYAPVAAVATVLYAIPSLALFIVLLDYTGLSDATMIIPLALYTLSVLIPNVVDGLDNVPDHVRQSATAMGFGTWRRLVRVELPVAVPVVLAGLRIATVSSISLVSIGTLIGDKFAGLGHFFTDGYQLAFPTEIWTGIAAIVILALAFDLLLVLIGRLLTPWARRPQRRRLQRRVEAAGTAAA